MQEIEGEHVKVASLKQECIILTVPHFASCQTVMAAKCRRIAMIYAMLVEGLLT